MGSIELVSLEEFDEFSAAANQIEVVVSW